MSLVRRERQIGDCAGDQHDQPGRKQASDAACIEVRQTCGFVAFARGDDETGDQETRNYKEHVHADEAARHGWHADVEQNHQQNRDRPQAFDGGLERLGRRRDRRRAQSGSPVTGVATSPFRRRNAARASDGVTPPKANNRAG